MKNLQTLMLGIAGLLVSLAALAHHSRSNFDLDTVVEVEGVVKEFSWVNPHSYVVIVATGESGDPVEWTFELNSTPVLKRFGWNSKSLAVGDHVLATGNPDRDANRRFIYANLFRKSDGTEIWSWGGPQVSPVVAATEGSSDFSGVWRIEFERDVLGADRPDDVLTTELPVTPKGQAEIDAFDPDANPEWDCKPETMPTILGFPYPFEVVRESDREIRLRYEVNNLERIVHLDRASVPDDVPRTPLGYSIGRIDGRVLTIETGRFAHVVWGAGKGVDSGERKRTVERYSLSEDGKFLDLEFVMQDPEYLSEPVTVRHRYDLTAGYTLQDYTCDPATARRHLTAGEN